VSARVLGLLRQGLAPEKLAFALAVGLGAGIFPVIGATTVLAMAIGAALRLNQPALQLTNWLAYPLQLALIVPFVRLGGWLAGAPPTPFAVSAVVARVVADPTRAVSDLGMLGLHGILGWLTVVPLVVLAVYGLVLPPVRAASRRVRRVPTTP
jgi:uncharacterized protein (DUF2062 family)